MESKTLREKCLYPECFWPISFLIRTEYEKIRNISPYSVWIQENTDQKNSEYGHFLRSESHQGLIKIKMALQNWRLYKEKFLKLKMYCTAWRVSIYRVISCPYFPAFGLNISIRILTQFDCGKIRTRNNSVFGHFSRRVGKCHFL